MTTDNSRLNPENDSESASSQQRVAYREAEFGCADLKLAIDRAVTRQACSWGIGIEQARILLLDRRMPV